MVEIDLNLNFIKIDKLFRCADYNAAHLELEKIRDFLKQKPDLFFTKKLLKYQIEHKLLSDNLDTCIELISEYESLFKDDFLILREKAIVFYLLKDFFRWKKTILKLQEKLENDKNYLSNEKNEQNLSTNDTYKIKLFLAKNLEEMGQIQQPLIIYQELLKNSLTLGNQLLIYAQILRIKSQWNFDHKISEIYSLIANSDFKKLPYHIAIEIQHALILFECELFQDERYLIRYNSLLNSISLNPIDKRLISFDLIEIILRLQKKLPLNLQNQLITANTEYEIYLKKFVDGKISCSNDLTMDLMTTYQFLKLCGLFIKKNISSGRDEIIKMYSFLIQGLPKNDKIIWKKYIKKDYTLSQTGLIDKIIFNHKMKTLIYKDNKLNISSRKIFLQMIEIFLQKNEISTDILIKKLWDGELSISYLNRLKVSIFRLNQKINEELGVIDCFEVSKNSVKTNYQFKSI